MYAPLNDELHSLSFGLSGKYDSSIPTHKSFKAFLLVIIIDNAVFISL